MTAIVKSVRCVATDILYASTDDLPGGGGEGHPAAAAAGTTERGSQCAVFLSFIMQEVMVPVICC